jgi:hypothetical protein
VIIADSDNHVIRFLSAARVVTTRAGAYPTPTPGLVDGQGTAARFRYPAGLALTPSGDVIVADWGNHAIRRIDPTGMVTTLAGGYPTPSPGFLDGVGTDAQFRYPQAVAVLQDHIIVADTENHALRKISPTGLVTLVAGGYPTAEFGLLDGLGASARFYWPSGLVVTGSGDLLVADYGNSAIRNVSLVGLVTTILGAYPAPSSGFVDGNPSTARINSPKALAVISELDIVIADSGNSAIRRLAVFNATSRLTEEPYQASLPPTLQTIASGTPPTPSPNLITFPLTASLPRATNKPPTASHFTPETSVDVSKSATVAFAIAALSWLL